METPLLSAHSLRIPFCFMHVSDGTSNTLYFQPQSYPQNHVDGIVNYELKTKYEHVHKSTSVYELTSKLLQNVPTGRYLLNQTSPPRHVKCSSTDGSTFSTALSRHGTELDTSGRLSLCASLRGHFSAAAVALHFDAFSTILAFGVQDVIQASTVFFHSSLCRVVDHGDRAVTKPGPSPSLRRPLKSHPRPAVLFWDLPTCFSLSGSKPTDRH